MAKAKKPKQSKTERLDNLKRELFCQTYVNDRDCFGNGTKSYARAYGFEELLNKLEGELVIIKYSKEDERKKKRREILDMTNVCKVNGARLLTNANVKERVADLFNEVYSDIGADKELAYAMKQTKDLASKVAAVREYNRVKNRVEEKVINNNVVYTWATTKDLRKGAKIEDKNKNDK